MRVKPGRDEDKKSLSIARLLAAASVMLATQACPTQTVYRRAAPPPPVASSPERLPPYSPPRDYPPPPQARAPVESGPIYEEDLRDRRPAPPPRIPPEPPARPAPSPLPPLSPPPAPPLAEETSLLAKITSGTSPQRAASIRLTEEGKRLLESGDHAKALARLEKTIAIDSTNPYGYYYLAKAHAYLGRQQESLKFLDIAESLLGSETYWLAEVFALRGENYRALGALDRAGASYAQALRLNPGNRVALDGLSRVQEEAPPGLR